MNNHKPRRVDVHKDEWVERCALQKVEIERLNNRVRQLEWELEKANAREANRHGFRQAVKWLAGLRQNGRTA